MYKKLGSPWLLVFSTLLFGSLLALFAIQKPMLVTGRAVVKIGHLAPINSTFEELPSKSRGRPLEPPQEAANLVSREEILADSAPGSESRRRVHAVATQDDAEKAYVELSFSGSSREDVERVLSEAVQMILQRHAELKDELQARIRLYINALDTENHLIEQDRKVLGQQSDLGGAIALESLGKRQLLVERRKLDLVGYSILGIEGSRQLGSISIDAQRAIPDLVLFLAVGLAGGFFAGLLLMILLRSQ